MALLWIRLENPTNQNQRIYMTTRMAVLLASVLCVFCFRSEINF